MRLLGSGFLVVLVVLLLGVWRYRAQPGHEFRPLALILHCLKYGIDAEPATSTTIYGAPPVALLEPGDILLSRHGQGPFGFWSHVTAVDTDAQVLWADKRQGRFQRYPVQELMAEAWLVLRLSCPSSQRRQAAAWLRDQEEQSFHLLYGPEGMPLWSCTGVVIRAYAHAGLDWQLPAFCTPDQLSTAQATVVYRRGPQAPDQLECEGRE